MSFHYVVRLNVPEKEALKQWAADKGFCRSSAGDCFYQKGDREWAKRGRYIKMSKIYNEWEGPTMVNPVYLLIIKKLTKAKMHHTVIIDGLFAAIIPA